MIQIFLAWIEATPFSTWLRESLSPWAFPTILTLHTVSMGFLAGMSAVIDLRILGVAKAVPLPEFKRFSPVFLVSLAISIVTGINLVIAYPTKALTNPVFWIKLTLIAVALELLYLIRRHVLRDTLPDREDVSTNAKALAAISLASWVLVIVAGRLLPYTYGRLLATE